MSAFFHFSELYKTFGRRNLLNNAELQLEGGQCIELRGKNGAGKSTLLRILAGLEKPDKAIVSIGGISQSWKKSRKLVQDNIMYLHQQPYMFDGSVQYNLSYPLRHLGENEREVQISKALNWAELEYLQHADANTLSGGEKQRVALARAWLHRPKVMLLDEPTANLDNASRIKTLQLLQTLREQGIALMIASHDSSHFHQLFDHAYELQDGRLKRIDDSAKHAGNVTPITKASA